MKTTQQILQNLNRQLLKKLIEPKPVYIYQRFIVNLN